jgi:thioredoxin 2
MHIACPACLSTNRVPEQRLGDAPVCGRCGVLLLPTEPVALSDAALSKYVANTQMPIVVDFWAEWCGPCKMMAPNFAVAAARLPKVRFVKVDSDAAPDSSARLRIRSIPTLLLFHGGQERARVSGAMPVASLVSWIESNLAKDVA